MMKIMKVPAILSICVLMLAACKTEDKEMLFNGKDLDNWEKVLLGEGNPEEVFKVEDGVIRVSGKPNGYLLTRDSYDNYKLHVEWRWTSEPTNSGVLLHVREINQEEWPLCIEAQLASGNAGDLVLIGSGSGISIGDSVYLVEPGERRYEVYPGREDSSEKPAGEWNSYDITCSGSDIELIVNGVLQNAGSGASFSKGRIALQSEGSPIEFRNVYIVPVE